MSYPLLLFDKLLGGGGSRSKLEMCEIWGDTTVYIVVM